LPILAQKLAAGPANNGVSVIYVNIWKYQQDIDLVGRLLSLIKAKCLPSGGEPQTRRAEAGNRQRPAAGWAANPAPAAGVKGSIRGQAAESLPRTFPSRGGWHNLRAYSAAWNSSRSGNGEGSDDAEEV